MSNLSPAKVRIEIFPKPKLFHDHFLKGWSPTGSVNFEYNDDVVQLYSETASISKSLSYSTSDYPIVAFRITYITASGVYIKGKLSGITKWSILAQSAGYFESNISSQYIGEIDEIVIDQSGIGEVRIDYLVIAKDNIFIPTGNYDIENLEIDLELADKAACGANFTLFNPNGDYSNTIPLNSGILIWISREESSLGNLSSKVFGGRIIKISADASGYGTGKISCECHSHSVELNFPPELISKLYEEKYGRTIIEDSLDGLSYLSYSHIPEHWFDNIGISGNTDDRISSSSTFSLDLDEEIPMKIVRDILEKSKNPSGIRGFDIFEVPSGVLIGHLRESEDFSVSGVLSPEEYSLSKDIYRVRNSLIIYGAQEKNSSEDLSFPESTSNWSADGCGNNLAAGNWGNFVKAGDYALKAYPSTGSKTGVNLCLKYLYSPDTDLTKKTSFTAFFFAYSLQAEEEGAFIDYAVLHLIDKNLNRVSYDIKNKLGRISIEDFNSYSIRSYTEIEIPVGPKRMKEGEWELTWGSSTFDWSAVRGYSFRTSMEWSGTIDTFGSFMLDWVHWGKAYFKGTVFDLTSQEDYGIKIKKIEDDSLMSDGECLARGNAELNFYKDPIIVLENFSVDGDLKFLPGYRVQVNIPQEDLNNEWMRIVSVKHSVKGSIWDTELVLSNEPQYIDYILRKKFGGIK